MWLLKAPESYPKDGPIFGEHRLINGHCLVQKQFWHNFLSQLKFEDVTPLGWPRSYRKADLLERVLHIHYGGNGDVLFSTPVYEAYKEKYPSAKHTVSTGAGPSELLGNNPNIEMFRLEEQQNIAQFVDQYDDAITYDCALAGNGESTIKNVYDIFLEWAGMEAPDEKKIPRIYLKDEEVHAVRGRMEKDFGISRRDKHIVFQPESSTNDRNINIDTAFEVAERLAADGAKVLLFGHSFSGAKIRKKTCSCGKKKYVHISEIMVGFSVPCECGAVLIFSKDDPPLENIWALAGYSLREVACVIACSDGFIGVDSCGIHIAAAFARPVLGIFSSFDGDLRMRYYKKANWIQKPYRCSPCFVHHIDCRWRQEMNLSVPPCMNQITAQEIVEAWKKLEADIAEQKEPEHTAPFIPREDVRLCPICSNDARKFVTRKGAVCYYDCLGCGTTYTDSADYPVGNYDEEDYWTAYRRDNYREAERFIAKSLTALLAPQYNHEGSILDVGCGTGDVVQEMQRLGWKASGLEFSATAIARGKEWGHTAPMIQADFLSWEPGEERVDVVSFSHSLEHFPEPRKAIEKALTLLTEKGTLSIIVPTTDSWVKINNKWPHINAYTPGEHQVLMPSKTLIGMLGSYNLDISIVNQDLDGSGTWWVLAKRKVQ